MPMPTVSPFQLLFDAAGKGGSVLDKVKNAFPSYEEETVVSVHGNGLSTKAELFKIAIAIAFGQTRRVNFLNFPSSAVAPGPALALTFKAPFYLQSDYDMMGKSVTVVLKYMYNGMFSQPLGTSNFLDRFFNELPSENIATDYPGGGWFHYLSLNSGFKESFHPGKLIATGDANLVNTGQFPSNPVPAGGTSDAGVRGSTFFECLVFAALAQSCTDSSSWQVPNNGQLATSPNAPSLNGPGSTVAIVNAPTESLISQGPDYTEVQNRLANSVKSALKNISVWDTLKEIGLNSSPVATAITQTVNYSNSLWNSGAGAANLVNQIWSGLQ